MRLIVIDIIDNIDNIESIEIIEIIEGSRIIESSRELSRILEVADAGWVIGTGLSDRDALGAEG
ncbi:MAG: hypothetical protein LIP03_06000 [Bacteroidales bacterium]|nr:hypothetical protein [Bacteroidales bacterium]